MQTRLLYIDQNIISDFRTAISDWSRLQNMAGVQWVYSNIHFEEIRRSEESQSYLTVLENLQACRIEITLNEEFKITGSTTVHPYTSPHQQYEKYLDTVSVPSTSEVLFNPLFARLLGVNNFDQLASLPDKFESYIIETLLKANLWDNPTAKIIGDEAEKLAQFIQNKLSVTYPLETTRESFGILNGNIGNPKTDNPIEEIWNEISAKLHGVTADRFFGFDPHDKQDYTTWPLYLGIIGCYTMLNMLGYRKDKNFPKEESLPNTFSDAQHVAHAAFCQTLISGDIRLCQKAKAIYRYKNIATEVVPLKFIRS
jgi:hypothetical protein